MEGNEPQSVTNGKIMCILYIFYIVYIKIYVLYEAKSVTNCKMTGIIEPSLTHALTCAYARIKPTFNTRAHKANV